MNRLPKIGERVRYVGGLNVGPCIGIVKRIYPSHVPAAGQDEEDENCRYIQGPFNPKSWHVHFEIEGDVPDPFVYSPGRAFAPSIADIESVGLNVIEGVAK